MRNARWLIPFPLLLWSGAAPLAGAEVGGQEVPRLRVGVVEAAPFAMAGAAGSFDGVAIEMWQRATRALGWSYTLIPVDHEGAIAQLERGQLDVAIGDMPMSPDLVRRVDCTVPYYACHFGIAYKPRSRLGTLGVLMRTLFSFGFLKVILSLLAILVAVGAIILLIERGWRNEEFGQSRSRGALYGIYWAAAMMSGVGERTPTTVRGRALALVWIFMGIFITSSFTAAITSNVTAEALSDRAPTREDLPRLHVAVLEGTFETPLRQLGGRVQVVDSERAAIQAVVDGRVDVCVGGAAVLLYESRNSFRDHSLKVAPIADRQTLQVFALAKESKLREPLNRAVLNTAFTREWLEIRSRYQD